MINKYFLSPVQKFIRIESFSGLLLFAATLIAFSLAILKLLGKSVPLSLKIFLTAFAIVDDLGAVLVIAVFYSGGIDWPLLVYSLLLLTVLFSLSYKGLYSNRLFNFRNRWSFNIEVLRRKINPL